MRMEVKAKRIRADKVKFSKTLHKNISRLFDGAVRAFLTEVALDDTIRVETGMSKASLLPLAAEVRMKSIIKATISPTIRRKKGLVDISGTYHPDKFKSAAVGEQLGVRGKAYVLNYGSPSVPVFKFMFSIEVYQYALYENGYGSVQAYNTLERGKKAFVSYLTDNLRDAFPKLADWLTIQSTKG
jgi:hypothetical protein